MIIASIVASFYLVNKSVMELEMFLGPHYPTSLPMTCVIMARSRNFNLQDARCLIGTQRMTMMHTSSYSLTWKDWLQEWSLFYFIVLMSICGPPWGGSEPFVGLEHLNSLHNTPWSCSKLSDDLCKDMYWKNHPSKVSALWGPRMLTLKIKAACVAISQDLLVHYKANPVDFHFRIVMCDETWINYYSAMSLEASWNPWNGSMLAHHNLSRSKQLQR